jgi:hypothetical protein
MSFMGKIDGDSQRAGGASWDDGAPIDHAASARENLKAVGTDLKKAFTPDKIKASIELMQGKGGGSDALAGVGIALGVLSLPWYAIADVAEVALMPVVAVKDAADAAIHGILSLLKKDK